MTNILHRKHHGFSLIEILIVISITATLLGVMMYRHSYTLTRSTFNQDCELFAASLKEMGTIAKKIGYLKINKTLIRDPSVEQPKTLTSLDTNYCIWIIKEKNTDEIGRIRSSGIISRRSKVAINASDTFIADAAKTSDVDIGAWVDLYLCSDPNTDINSLTGQPAARIIFQPNALPYKSGSIQIGLVDGKTDNVNRWQQIDVERSGAITVNTVEASRLDGDK